MDARIENQQDTQITTQPEHGAETVVSQQPVS